MTFFVFTIFSPQKSAAENTKPATKPSPRVATPLATTGPATKSEASPSNCPFDAIADCKTLRRRPAKENGVFNPLAAFLNQSELAEEDRRWQSSQKDPRERVHFQRQWQRAQKLAEEVRGAARELVTSDTRRELLSTEQKAMLERLSKLTFELADSADHACIFRVPRGFPNATYDRMRHTVSLCPATVRLHDGQLIRILAHEISHALSPCVMKNSLFEVSRSLRQSNSDHEAISKCLQDDDPKTANQLSRLFGDARFSIPESFDDIKTLAACGLLQELPSTKVNNHFLFNYITKCIEHRYRKNWQATIENLMRSTTNESGSLELKRKQLEEENPIQCEEIVEEHFADAISGRLIEELIQKRALKTEGAQAVFVDMAGYSCLDKENNIDLKQSPNYPPMNERIQLVLGSSAALGLLGCPERTAPSDLCAAHLRAGKGSEATTGDSRRKTNGGPAQPTGATR